MKRFLLAAAALAAAMATVQAADLPAQTYKGPAVVPPPPPPMWTGFYIGASAGYGWGDQTLTFGGTGTTGTLTSDLGGLVYGGHIGFNWQLPSSIVVGVEADINGSGASDTVAGVVTIAGAAVNATVTNKITYWGTVRGRLGYAFGSIMPYLTGGWAYVGSETTATFTVGGATAVAGTSGTQTNGWVLGGGVEWMMSPNLILGAEYLYVNFPGDSATAAGVTVSTSDFQASVGRGRVSWKF